jgi:RNA polymerase sigma-70 factor (ECF subfamily)
MLAPFLAEHDARPPAADAEQAPSFARLYEEHFSFVWRSARRLGAPEAIVDDVVQEVFVIVHRRLSAFEGHSSMRTWLFGIILNVVRAHRRSLRTKHPHMLSAAPTVDVERLVDGAAGPQEAAMREEATHLVDRLLDELDDTKRAVFVLAELEQMSAPEIALALGTPLNTVYSRLRLARQEFTAAAARHRARDEWRTR